MNEINNNPHNLEIGKYYWVKYVYCGNEWEKVKITRLTVNGHPWGEWCDKTINGILAPGSYEIRECENKPKTHWTADEVVDFAANMIQQYRFGNTNIQNKEILKESLLSKTN